MASNVPDFVKLGEKGIILNVIKGDLIKQQADVLVCSCMKNLDLSRGAISRSLVSAGGQSLQEECRQKYPDGIDYTNIAVIKGGNLGCREVYLLALPIWGSGQKEIEILDAVITRCLETAHRHRHVSMVVPALGCGLQKYPPEETAQCIKESIQDFSNNHPFTTVEQVTIVVYHTDNRVYESFLSTIHNQGPSGSSSKEDKRMNGAISAKISKSQKSHPSKSHEPVSINSIFSSKAFARQKSVKNLDVSVTIGDISAARADVIVCPTTTELELEINDISAKILQKAGFEIQLELHKRCPRGLQPGLIAVTKGHNLSCSQVFYVVMINCEKEYNAKKVLCKCVCACLERGQNEGVESIVFPALGMGQDGVNEEVVAKTIMKCFRKYKTEHNETSIQEITIVVDEELKNATKLKKLLEREKKEQLSSKDEDEEDYALGMNPFITRNIEASMRKALERQQPRGTKEWYKMMFRSELRSPCYWEVYNSSRTLKNWLMDVEEITPKLITVDDATFEAIKHVVEQTWISKHVGSGKDASGLGDLNYKQIRVKHVERIENCELFEKYAQMRQEFFHKHAKKGACMKLDSVRGSSGPILTSKHIPDQSPLTQEMYPEINEHYLFHGTKADKVSIILKQGLDSRLSDSSAMFGTGIYMAESSTKSDQYADDKHKRSLGEKKMLLVRACLGDVVIQKLAKTFLRAPCCTCGEDKCSCTSNSFYGAVVADGSWNFREFVVYDRQQVYPEYVITYTRI